MRRIFVVLMLCGLATFVWRMRALSTSSWQRLAPDLEMRILKVRAVNTLSGEVQVIALRTIPSRLHIARGSTLEASEWQRKTRARAVINGGYFGEDGKSLGLRICDGKKFGGLHPADWGVFFVKSGKARILHTRDFKRKYKGARNISQAIQCGPRLVVNGRTTRLKPQTARRTAMGIQRDGRVVLAVSDGTLTFQEWAKLWADKTALNCPNALNLDGGGSTQICLKTAKKKLEITGSWPVPDVVLVR